MAVQGEGKSALKKARLDLCSKLEFVMAPLAQVQGVREVGQVAATLRLWQIGVRWWRQGGARRRVYGGSGGKAGEDGMVAWLGRWQLGFE
jgi:hypothetical protein